MSKGSELLEVQALDLASDKLRQRREALPERAALRASLALAVSIDEAHGGLLERRKELSVAERAVGTQVADIAAKAKDVENTLYSGTVKAAKELEALQEEVRLIRERQSGFEEQEMELLEEIDAVETASAENRAALVRCEADTAAIREAIAKAEGEIDAELADIAGQCALKRGAVSPAILVEYDRLRLRERLGGRAAASLTDGTCGACRVRLPVVDYNRIRHEPNDVLACCPRCLRVLVR